MLVVIYVLATYSYIVAMQQGIQVYIALTCIHSQHFMLARVTNKHLQVARIYVRSSHMLYM